MNNLIINSLGNMRLIEYNYYILKNIGKSILLRFLIFDWKRFYTLFLLISVLKI